MSIEIVTQDLVDLLKGVTEFTHDGQTWVGLAIGGQDIDPTNRHAKLPMAWAVYVGDDIVSGNALNPCQSLIKSNFVVKVLVEYDNEANLISTHLPLLHTVVTAIQGGEPVTGSKWAYEGQGLESIDDRLVFNQQYSILYGV